MRKILLALVLVLLLSGCNREQPKEESQIITDEWLQSQLEIVTTAVNIRYNGFDNETNVWVYENIHEENASKIATELEELANLEPEDRIVSLDLYLMQLEDTFDPESPGQEYETWEEFYNLIGTDPSTDVIIKEDGSMWFDPENLHYTDGIAFVYLHNFIGFPFSKSEEVYTDSHGIEYKPVQIGLYQSIGNERYNFSVSSYNYFENGDTYVYLISTSDDMTQYINTVKVRLIPNEKIYFYDTSVVTDIYTD